uniref:Uncharacterized protein n=1 Tax=Fagus sylvatica TaxID=28930 RepID=A0A2N9IZN7_FAGSY
MTNLFFEIEIHSGGQFERNPKLVYLGGKVSTYCKVDPDRLSYFEIQDMVAECGSPSTSLFYYLIPRGSLEQGLRLIIGDDEVLYMCKLHGAWPIDRITLYVEGGVEQLQVVGQSDFGGVVDEGDELEGDEVEGNWMSIGDELEGDELNEGDEGNVFGNAFEGDEGEMRMRMIMRLWAMGGILQVMLSHQADGDRGNNASELSHQWEPGVGSNEGNNAQPEVGNNRQPEVGNNAQPAMGIDRIRVRQYAPSTTRPNQPDVQEPNWTELDIEDYEIHTGAISDDEDPRDGAPEFNQQTGMRKPDLVLGMKFPNSRVFREALKNDYGWRLYASVVPRELTFQIKTFQSVCTCDKSFQHSQVNSSYVARKYLQDFGKNPKWEVAGVQHHVRQDISVELTMIRKTNVGSKVYIKCDCSEDGGQPRFLRMYVRYHAKKVGFLAGCRPIIGLDGCHLKGRFGGQLLATTARDRNDNIFPVAVAVVEQECKESWIWFLKHFSEDIGDPQDLNLVFISDRQKGLVPAFKKLFPKVEHRYCLKHIYSNFKLLFKGLELKDALWSYAAASTEREFKRRMEYLKGLDEKAWKWLSKILAKQWCKAYFTKRTLSDCLVNNISESFNAMILLARDKPILSMLEWIRVRLMTKLHTKRIGMEKYGGSVCPNVQNKLEKLKMESWSFSAMPSGISCKHGVAAIYKNLEHPEDYLHDCYLKEAYLDAQGGSSAATNQGHTSSQAPSSQPSSSQPQPSQPATTSRSAQWFSSTQPTTHAPRETWHSRASSSQPVSVRDSIARRCRKWCRGRGATSGAGSGVGKGSGVGAVVQAVVQADGRGAGMGSTSGQASGAGKGFNQWSSKLCKQELD